MQKGKVIGYVIVSGSLELGVTLLGNFKTQEDALDFVCSDPHVEILPVYGIRSEDECICVEEYYLEGCHIHGARI